MNATYRPPESFANAAWTPPVEPPAVATLDLNQHLVSRPASSFFVGVSGDSMCGAGIFHGDMLVVDAAAPRTSGQVVVIRHQGEVLVKRLLEDGDRVFLKSECAEPHWAEVGPKEELDILGCVMWVLHKP